MYSGHVIVLVEPIGSKSKKVHVILPNIKMFIEALQFHQKCLIWKKSAIFS